MAKSPCIGCEFELADKNNPTCRECDKRVEYVALIAGDGGSIMGETKETGAQASPLATPGRQESERNRKPKRSDNICLIEGCDFKMLNRGLCSMHYQQWRLGKIVHPVLGKFTVSQARIRSKAKTNLVKKTPVKKISDIKTPTPVIPAKAGIQEKTETAQSMPENVLRVDGLIINLDNYPRIKHQINFLADKYLVNSEHVIIGLLGEALASRARLRDASPGEERP